MWFYAGEGNSQLQASVPELRAKFEDGEIDGLTLVWRPGMAAWQPLSEVEELKRQLVPADDDDEEAVGEAAVAPQAPAPLTESSAADSTAASYLYADPSTRAQQGPVTVDALLSLAAAGYLAAETLVWTAGMEGWQPIAAVPALKSVMKGLAAAVSHPSGGEGQQQDGQAAAEEEEAATDSAASASMLGKRQRDAEEEADSEAREVAGAADGSSSMQQGQGAPPAAKKARRNRRSAATPKENPWVYVTGLPPDVTEDELARHFKKAGIIRLDYETSAPRIKIYRAEPAAAAVAGEGQSESRAPCKGDGSICYLKEESVELAITLLDGVELRPGCPLSVSQAVFDTKGGKSHSKGSSKAEKHRSLTPAEQAAKMRALGQQAALSWAEEGDDSLGLKVVVLRHVFTQQEAQEPGFAAELEEDIRAEVQASCGTISKLRIYTGEADGVVTIKFADAGAAALALQTLNGRWFGGRQLAAEYWDGLTNFAGGGEGQGQGEEDEEEEEADEERRLEAFGDWLEAE